MQCLPERHTIQSCPFPIDREIKNGTQGDGAQHSITLLTNTSELDSKDTINQKPRPGRLIPSLMDIRRTAVTSGRSCDCVGNRRSHSDQRGKAAAHVSVHRQKARQLGVHSTWLLLAAAIQLLIGLYKSYAVFFFKMSFTNNRNQNDKKIMKSTRVEKKMTLMYFLHEYGPFD